MKIDVNELEHFMRVKTTVHSPSCKPVARDKKALEQGSIRKGIRNGTSQTVVCKSYFP